MRGANGSVSRRDLLVGAAAASVGALATKSFGLGAERGSKQRGFRFAHLTDLHIGNRKAVRGARRAVQHALAGPDRAQMIVTGGDLVFDSMACPARHVEKQWRHVKQVFSPQLGVRVEHILGNHDIWGIDRDRSQTTGSEALYGKKWAMQVLGLDRTYRSFDEGGWHWILLDDVMGVPEKKIYEGLLDETQFAWLVADLLQTPSSTPVIVLTHVPILGASVFFPPQCTHKRSWDLPFSMMHADANRLLALFEQHDNVRLCLSGHTHLVDEVKYKGITYLCNGAVCGNWWMGNFQGFRPGYSMIDLHSDGTFASQYMTYDAA